MRSFAICIMPIPSFARQGGPKTLKFEGYARGAEILARDWSASACSREGRALIRPKAPPWRSPRRNSSSAPPSHVPNGALLHHQLGRRPQRSQALKTRANARGLRGKPLLRARNQAKESADDGGRSWKGGDLPWLRGGRTSLAAPARRAKLEAERRRRANRR